jgi:hypothetical protein
MILQQVRRRAKKRHLAVIIIIIIIIFKAGKEKKKNYKSGSFPQLILTEEKKRTSHRNASKYMVGSGPFSKLCALKLALREVFTAIQIEKSWSCEWISSIIGAKDQLIKRETLLMARIIVRESPLRRREWQPKEEAN